MKGRSGLGVRKGSRAVTGSFVLSTSVTAARRSRPGTRNTSRDRLGGDAFGSPRGCGSGLAGEQGRAGRWSTGRGEEAKDADSWAAARGRLQEAGRRTGVQRRGWDVCTAAERQEGHVSGPQTSSPPTSGLVRGARTGLRAEPERAEEGAQFGTLPRRCPRGPSPSCRWKPRGRVRARVP